MFPKKLSGVLSRSAVTVNKSRSSRSVYYQVNGVTVRLSDHSSKRPGYDLAIYYVNRHYIIVARHGNSFQSLTLQTKEQVLQYIDVFASFKQLFVGF